MALDEEDREFASRAEIRNRRSLDRMLALSDGVFAIAITLLVLQLTAPEIISSARGADVGSTLADAAPKILVYGIGFTVIALYWVGHRRLFLLIERTDGLLTFLNLALLMCIAFMPFPTAVLGQFTGITPVLLYAATQTVTGSVNLALWLHAVWGRRLVSPSLSSRLVLHHTLRTAIAPVVFLLSMAIAPLSPIAAQFSWGAVIVFLGLLNRVFPPDLEDSPARRAG
jgi:uncharacterized membrane protein